MITNANILKPVYVLINYEEIRLVTLIKINRNPETNLPESVLYRDTDGKIKKIDSELCFEYGTDVSNYKKDLSKLISRGKIKRYQKTKPNDTNLIQDMYDFLQFVSDADWIDLGKRRRRTELSVILKRAKKQLNIKE